MREHQRRPVRRAERFNTMSKYIKKETKGQILFIVLIILAVIIGLAWNFIEDESTNTWKPTVSYPMANSKISWLQTFHPGGWENAGT